MGVTVAELERDLADVGHVVENLRTKFTQVDRKALNALDIVMENPEGAEVLSIAASLVGLNLPPGVIAGWAAGGKAILSLFPPPAEPAAAAGAPSPVPAAAAA